MEGLDRIIKEFKDLVEEPLENCGITVSLFDKDNYRRWKVSLMGPKDTSYEGGLFYLSVTFPEDYPKSVPDVFFLTPIYHLNINPNAPKFPGSPSSESLGHVSISILNWWRPSYTMREVLISIFVFLYLPNPDSPYGLERADEFRNIREVYEEKIKLFTKRYADPMKGEQFPPSNKDWDFSL